MMWECLPPDIIIAVAERLAVVDLARLRCVCTSWASALKESSPSFPWLMKPLDDLLFSVPDKRCYRLSHVDDVICGGAAAGGISVNMYHRDGWIAFLPDGHHLPVLFNPLSGKRLPLPSIRTLSHPTHCRLRSSGSFQCTFVPCPAARNVTFVLYGYPFRTYLAFARPGDEDWTCVSATWAPSCLASRQFGDVAYHRGKFYALYVTGELLAFDVGPSAPTEQILLARNGYEHVPELLSGDWPSRVMFLASSPASGDLLHIRPRGGRGAKNFLVAKFDEGLDGWVEMEDLGGSCMFVDKSQAMLISPQDVPVWATGNNIYLAGSAIRDSIYLPTPFFDSDFFDDGGDVRIFAVGDATANCRRLSISGIGGRPSRLFWFRPMINIGISGS